MSQDSAQCSNCGFLLSELPNFIELVECPHCGSSDRHIMVSDTVKVYEQGKLKAKDPLKTGKKKIRKEAKFGDDLHVESGKWNKRTMIIDKDKGPNGEYFEEIIDPETGEVIHLVKEPLSDHRNHGSAKSKS
jgi:hypothetical protein